MSHNYDRHFLHAGLMTRYLSLSLSLYLSLCLCISPSVCIDFRAYQPRSHYCQHLTLSVGLSVCLSCPFNLLLFCLSMESSHFLAISSRCCTLLNAVLRFWICCHGNEIWAILHKIEIASSFLLHPCASVTKQYNLVPAKGR